MNANANSYGLVRTPKALAAMFASAIAFCATMNAAIADTSTLQVADVIHDASNIPVAMQFPVSRNGDLGFDVLLNYHTVDGTAIAGTDYTAVAGSLAMSAGSAGSTIPVTLSAHAAGPPSVNFQLQVDGAVGVGPAPTFAAQQTFATGAVPRSVVAADFNGDGRLDLLVANQNDNNVSVFLNTTVPGAATPTFAPRQSFAAGLFVVAATAGDINSDGRPDIVVVNQTGGNVTVLINTTPPGATIATFSTQPVIAVDSNIVDARLVDLNGDGKVDLIVTSPSNDRISILRNTTPPGAAAPTFAAAQTFSTGDYPLALGVADLNGDGKPDLVTANYLGSTISVLLNTTDVTGTSLSFTAQMPFATGLHPESVSIADVNGDGMPDLVVPNQGDNTVSVFRNTMAAGAASPSFAAAQAFGVGVLSAFAQCVDLNGDGKPDIAVVNNGDANVSVLRNTTVPGATQLSFSLQQTFGLASPAALVAADFNGDGRIDLAAANRNSNNVSVLLNTTPASAAILGFTTQQGVPTPGGAFAGIGVDINGDGKPDLVSVDAQLNSSVDVELNTTAPGAMTPAFTAAQTFSLGGTIFPKAVVAADLNGDGRQDLIVAKFSTNSVAVLLNTTAPGASSASFAAAQDFATGTGPYSVCAADINGDGRPDLVVANPTNNNVSVLLNTAPTGAALASFSAQQIFAVGSSPQSVACADFDGDGHIDVVTANVGANTVSILRNTTQRGATMASFATQQTFATGFGPQFVATADLNGDGVPDLVVANVSANTVSVLLNTTPRGATTYSFTPQLTFPTGTGPKGIRLSDFDGDGRTDILVANSNVSSISLLLNTTAIGAITPSFAAQRVLTTSAAPLDVIIADVNGDGRADPIAVNGDGSLGVFINRQYAVPITGSPATGTIVHDVIFANGFD
jgi:trimeric autotransporter adhesin